MVQDERRVGIWVADCASPGLVIWCTSPGYVGSRPRLHGGRLCAGMTNWRGAGMTEGGRGMTGWDTAPPSQPSPSRGKGFCGAGMKVVGKGGEWW